MLCASALNTSCVVISPAVCLAIKLVTLLLVSRYFLGNAGGSCPASICCNERYWSLCSLLIPNRKRHTEGWWLSNCECRTRCQPSILFVVRGMPSTVWLRTFQNSIGNKAGALLRRRLGLPMYVSSKYWYRGARSGWWPSTYSSKSSNAASTASGWRKARAPSCLQ